jgi:hypothetical protein
MTKKAARVRTVKPRGAAPAQTEEGRALERTLIRTSMRKWESIDLHGRELGRGLGRKELIERVARDVGTSLRHVLSALKSAP